MCYTLLTISSRLIEPKQLSLYLIKISRVGTPENSCNILVMSGAGFASLCSSHHSHYSDWSGVLKGLMTTRTCQRFGT